MLGIGSGRFRELGAGCPAEVFGEPSGRGQLSAVWELVPRPCESDLGEGVVAGHWCD